MFLAPALLALDVSVQQSVESPAPLGTRITWTAIASDSDEGVLWYRFRSRAAGSTFQIIRDFGPESSLEWTAYESEGLYEMEITVRNLATGASVTNSKIIQMDSRVLDGVPVVNTTPHMLVFLYSAPECASPGRMRVQFQPRDGAASTFTPFKDCKPNSSMNFYLAGVRPATEYVARHFLDTGSGSVHGPDVTFTTPEVNLQFAPRTVLHPRESPSGAGVWLQSTLAEMTMATDLSGNLIWYYAGGVSSLTRPSGDGKFLGLYQLPKADPSLQIVREFDLAGFTLRETNASRVNEQLQARGMHPITAFHHEARRLSDGNIVVLASTERILTDVQGPGEVNVLGDDILVLNDDLEVIWAWDSFDHMDVRRKATLDETCTQVGGGCPPFLLTPVANDWLHGNAIQETPDGNLLYSTRHQDWLVKIDYRSGQGIGNVLWRLGKDGDFQFISDDPFPWFSHQHDGAFAPDGKLTVFDNGNLRAYNDQTAHSRGQAWILDEVNMTATEALNADLGAYAFALGSAYQLPDGGYFFNVGLVLGSGVAHGVEVDNSGTLIFSVEASTPLYRSFRLSDLYTAPSY